MNHHQVKMTAARDGAVVSDARRHLCRISGSTEGPIYQTEVYVSTGVPLGVLLRIRFNCICKEVTVLRTLQDGDGVIYNNKPHWSHKQTTCSLQLRTIHPHLIIILTALPRLNNSLSNCPPKGRCERDRDSIANLSELLFQSGT